jgi:catechol 2,3-dioxygenase-like lactoylglutathione lyase family enzyme
MATMNLFQVNLFVDDFAAMLAFYRDALGFDVTDVDSGPPCIPMVNWASLRTGTLTIELFDAATFGTRNCCAAQTEMRFSCASSSSMSRGNGNGSKRTASTAIRSSAKRGARTHHFVIRRATGCKSTKCLRRRS